VQVFIEINTNIYIYIYILRMVSPLISIRLFGRILVLLGSSTLLLVTQHYLKPRLPIYIIQMNIIPTFYQQSNSIIHVPIQFIKSHITKQWQTVMSTNIHFYNENFLHITVHAMTFDIYIEKYDRDGDGGRGTSSDDTTTTGTRRSARTSATTSALLHVGTITDQYQHVTYDHRFPNKGTSSNILWSIPGRSNFTQLYCPLYISLQPILPVVTVPAPAPTTTSKPHNNNNNTTSSNTKYTHQRDAIITYYKSILHVIYQLLKHTLYNMFYNPNKNHTHHQSLSYYTIPTTGVAHIRTSAIPVSPNQTYSSSPLGSLPFTVSMVCDNIINIMQLQIIGTYCTIRTIQPGWNQHISTAAQTIRNYAIQHLSIYNTTTGSIHQQINK
jgi:hypothetical protein